MENGHQCVVPVHKPSLKELTFFFSLGVLVSIPFTLFFAQFYPYFPSALALIILAPFIEEIVKVFPLFYRHGETERSIVKLGILIGLGFGVSELVLYVAFLDAPLIVRISGVIFHASSAAVTAYGIAKKNPLPYYLLSVVLHATNNFFAYESELTSGLFIDLIVLIAAYFLAWRFYNRASNEKMVL